MNSIRRSIYTVVLTLSALNFSPSPAAGQDAAGTFTLTKKVRWQNAVVPAGKYHFTAATSGPSEMLTLRNVDGSGAGFMLLVSDAENSGPSDLSQLVVVSRPGGSYVSAMQLPEFGLTLHFAVPAERREVAKAVPSTTTTTTASAAR
jgi:hypothetical protein